MIAILGVLLEENDADFRPPAQEFNVPGEYTEIEISRVAVYAQVPYVPHQWHRTPLTQLKSPLGDGAGLHAFTASYVPR